MSCATAQALYWGGSAEESLDAAGVQALANTREAKSEQGQYAFEQLVGVYAFLAYPLAFGDRETMLINGLNVAGPITTVAIDGVDYQVQRTPRVVTAPDLMVTLR